MRHEEEIPSVEYTSGDVSPGISGVVKRHRGKFISGITALSLLAGVATSKAVFPSLSRSESYGGTHESEVARYFRNPSINRTADQPAPHRAITGIETYLLGVGAKDSNIQALAAGGTVGAAGLALSCLLLPKYDGRRKRAEEQNE